MHQVILETLERVQYIGMIDGITPYFLAQSCFVKGHINDVSQPLLFSFS